MYTINIIIGSKSLYIYLCAPWSGISVITSPNQNLSEWNLEYKWGAMVHTHKRKMGEFAPGVPPKGTKMCFVFFCFQCNVAFRPLILHRFGPFLGDRLWNGSPYGCYQTVVCLSCLSCLFVCDVGVLWLNGWMDQDETWHGGRPRPPPHCIRWGPSSPKGGTVPPNFRPCPLWLNGWMNQHATWYRDRPRPGDIVFNGDPAAPFPPKKEGTAPSFHFGPYLLWLNGWMDQDATWYGGRLRPRRHC